MLAGDLTKTEQKLIKSLLSTYESHKPQITLFHSQLVLALESSAALKKTIHSMRSRLKDPDHLVDKLARKMRECKKEKTAFDIAPGNLLLKVNDLVGVRLLHLFTRQITDIDAALREVFQEGKYQLIEGPFARTWDDESREFFKACNIETQESPSMYTSVHYVIGSASRTTVTAEVQVRTLMEEVWGEVDHTMNYPHPVGSVACREQLKVLARVTSGASRLVDSIFATLADHEDMLGAKKTLKRSVQRRR
jgi:putative GTP pyrophosphokinase